MNCSVQSIIITQEAEQNTLSQYLLAKIVASSITTTSKCRPRSNGSALCAFESEAVSSESIEPGSLFRHCLYFEATCCWCCCCCIIFSGLPFVPLQWSPLLPSWSIHPWNIINWNIISLDCGLPAAAETLNKNINSLIFTQFHLFSCL